MSEVKNDPTVYVIGGPVQAGKGIYVPRKADDELLSICRAGDFAYVLTPRQMGKSSLMERTIACLRREDIRTVKIDLNQIGTEVTEEQWYLGILTVIESDLQLDTNIFDWWDSHERLGTAQRLTLFFRDVLLKEVKERVVIFVDEIDSTLGLPFTDDLFAAIRYLYHARVETPEFERLSFVLIGVATPSDLIKEAKRTPFNIGRRVDLTDFTFNESLPLARALGLLPDETERLHRWVLEWTSGYPYLTQRLYRAVAESGKESWSKAEVDSLVTSLFFGQMSKKDSNLQTVRDMLAKRPEEAEKVLTTYRDILRNKRPVVDEEQDVIKSHIKLSGVVCNEDGVLRVRNRIYREVFNEEWVARHLPVNWRRRMIKAAAVLAATLFIISIPTTVFAIYQWRQATQEAVKAQNAQRAAELARADAVQQRDRAESALTEAQTQRTRAEQAAAQALRSEEVAKRAAEQEKKAKEQEVAQRKRAEEQEQLAVRARKSAEASALEAKRDRELALASAASEKLAKEEAQKQKTLADAQRVEAQKQAREADAQRTLAEAARKEADEQRAIAIKKASEAEVQHDKAVRSQLASEAASLAKEPGRLQNSVLLANASLGMGYSAPAYQALIDGLKLLPKPLPALNHKGSVSGVGFSPDGTYLVTVGTEPEATPTSGDEPITTPARESEKEEDKAKGALWVWERDTGREVTLRKPVVGVKAIAYGLTGEYLATTDKNNAARVWKWENNTLVEFGGPVTLAAGTDLFAVSPDGRYIAAARRRSIVKSNKSEPPSTYYVSIWEIPINKTGDTGGKPTATIPVTDASAIAFSPQDGHILVGDRDSVIQLWNFKGSTPAEIAHASHPDTVHAIAVSRDGRLFAAASTDGNVKVWALGGKPDAAATPEPRSRGTSVEAKPEDNSNVSLLLSFSLDQPSNSFRSYTLSLVFSPDGKYLAASGGNSAAQVWAINGYAANKEALLTHDAQVTDLAFSPDGRYVASAGEDGVARAWDVSARGSNVISTFQPYTEEHSANYFFTDSPHLVSSSREGDVWVQSIFSKKPLVQLKDAPGRLGYRMSSDGKYVTTVNSELWRGRDEPRKQMDYTIKVWEVKGGRNVSSVTVKNLTLYDINSDGKYLATLNEDGTFRLFNTADGREVVFMKDKPLVEDFALSPDGSYVALLPRGDSVNEVRILEVSSGRPVASLVGAKDITTLTFSDDGKSLASVGQKGNAVYFWSTRGGEPTLLRGDNLVYAKFSSSGRYLLGYNRSERSHGMTLWETATGRQITRFESSSAGIRGDVFSQNEEFLVLYDGSGVRVVLTATGCEIARVQMSSKDVMGFSPDNRYLLGVSMSGHSKTLWQPEELRSMACEYVTRNLTSDEWHNQYMIEAKLPQICWNLSGNPDTSDKDDLKNCNVKIPMKPGAATTTGVGQR